MSISSRSSKVNTTFVKETVTYTLSCRCVNQIIVSCIKDAEKVGWVIHRNCHSTDISEEMRSITAAFCPSCAATEKKRKYNSTDIREKIDGGYYEDHPNDFSVDAIKHVGLERNSRATRAMSLAYETGHSYGLSEVLIHLEKYADLLIGE